jgi:diaminohydroxyphosphoribosylaminopyrimidine deaminase / 5-amino-6-(5-phosphoribosylamino)uracil reductase
MTENDNIKFMRRCLDLAGRAEGMTCPNPMVGSVIVYNGKIIGEGYHLKAGSPHAEVLAIKSVSDKKLLRESTLFVNLEPCSHYGKTPPCADLIIESGIKRVVIGTTDTSKNVSGKGIKKLKDAGIEVVPGVLEEESRFINRRFFTFNEKQRPYIILKWAQSSDGFLDILRDENGGSRPLWITGNSERALVHRWRASEQAILVGANTVRADNPKLNVREWTGENPVRVIMSRSGHLDSVSDVFRMNGTNIVFTSNTETEIPNADIVKLDKDECSFKQVVKYLYNIGIQSLLVEGGAEILSGFISSGLWDEARIFYGKSNFGNGVKAPEINGTIHLQAEFSLSSVRVIRNETSGYQ